MSSPRFWLIGLLALTPLALGPTSQALAFPQAMKFTVEGKITQQSKGKLTISTGENMVFYVRYDDKTEIKRADGSTGTAEDLRLGAHIKVDGDLTEAGDIIAKTIQLQANPQAKHR